MSNEFKYEVSLKSEDEPRRYGNATIGDSGWLKCSRPEDGDSEDGKVTTHWIPSENVEQVSFERDLPRVDPEETGVRSLG